MDIKQPPSCDISFLSNVHPDRELSGYAPIPLSIKLERLSFTKPESCIFRVHKHLRELNKEAYEPEIIAIGPYHCKKENLLWMEEHKLRYLRSLLDLKKENVERYVGAIRPLDQQVRGFYAEQLHLTEDELAEMMVLDGCFIIQLVRQYNKRKWDMDANDPINVAWIKNTLRRDLMLFENQIPFFILSKLFGMIEDSPDGSSSIHNLILQFVLPVHLYGPLSPPKDYSKHEVKHLLDLLHIYWEPCSGPRDQGDSREDFFDGNPMVSATKLRDAGVKFELGAKDSCFDISFEGGTFIMPTFTIEDLTESFLRNLMAYELHCESTRPNYVTDYVTILDYLIDSSEDVELLYRHGILENYLGDNEVEVARLFNKMAESVFTSVSSRCATVLVDVEEYRKKPRNKLMEKLSQWVAQLKRNYLNGPWGVISVAAATILLLLTVMQTIFAIFPRK